jgi:hypothetical protein
LQPCVLGCTDFAAFFRSEFWGGVSQAFDPQAKTFLLKPAASGWQMRWKSRKLRFAGGRSGACESRLFHLLTSLTVWYCLFCCSFPFVPSVLWCGQTC